VGTTLKPKLHPGQRTHKVVRLSDVSQGRDNNLNLIRMIAALSVLVSHAWPLALGMGTEQPLERLTGFQLGTQAVYVFFAISGFLIARSYEHHGTVREWAAARVLRIFPGLAVVLVIMAFGLGPLLTELSPRDYLTDPATWTYVPANLTLAFRQIYLPGLTLTNGPLWTLEYEVLCYFVVLAMGLAGAFRSRLRLALVVGLFVAANLAMVIIPDRLPMTVRNLLSLGLPFACGVAFYMARRWLPLTPWLLLPFLLLIPLLRDTVLHQPIYVLTLVYATFLLAYLPGGPIRRYNRVGDFSFGIYIYAWPVQQTMVDFAGPMSPLTNIVLSVPVALALAWLSWHLVEKPALGWMRSSSRAGAAQVPSASRRQ
jgi:peptidoglycan/LPS O-acetylase OafA/YrhL